MIVDVARKLASFVNIKKNMDSLEIYMESRIEDMHKVLEQTEDIREVHMAQGAIRELKRLKTLRDEVLASNEKKYHPTNKRGVDEKIVIANHITKCPSAIGQAQNPTAAMTKISHHLAASEGVNLPL